MKSKHILIIAIALLLIMVSCKRQSAPDTELQPNTVKEFTFQGGSFKDGKIYVSPDVKVEPGDARNKITLMRPNGNGIEVTCFCILEGGDCWAVSNDTSGGVGVGCASQNCAGGGEPFCFMDLNDDTNGFKIRLVVSSRK